MGKLNTNSNAYIIIYSAILVVIVAFLLAFIFKALKPMQDANVALDIKKQILYSLNIRNLDGAEAEAKYAEVVKNEGEIDGQKYYACEIDGEDILVVSLKGMGLWGGISGYISIHGDEEPVVYGAYFNHESETAGLGAEIKDSQAWQEKFIGKKVFVDPADGSEVALAVVKNVEDPETQVDCVTGATLTSNGVNDMIKVGLKDAGKRFVQLFVTMQCVKDSDMDCCKDSTEVCCKHSDKDCCKDSGKDCCKDSDKDCCKDSDKDCCKGSDKDCCKDSDKDCCKDSDKDCCKDSPATSM